MANDRSHPTSILEESRPQTLAEKTLDVAVNPFSKPRLNLIKRLDWRLFLPFGVAMAIYAYFYAGYPSIIGYLGVACVGAGAANLGIHIFLTEHLPYAKNAPKSVQDCRYEAI